ncbi:diguanylate cyclase domain-containing protein [Alteromonas sp. AMM-1]|uniref:diguanylate cyclase domain-containing protein n=1 Tax=Alteromonas sp. AMM-1 TaxID=3394233 RepID=UPI0039A57919
MDKASWEAIGPTWQDRSTKLKQIIDMQTAIAKVGMDLSSVMHHIVEYCCELLKCDGAAIELREDNHMVYRATSGIANAHSGLRLPLNESLSGYSVKTGELQLCNDVEQDPRVNLAACQTQGIESMLLIPLEHSGDFVGVLKVLSRKKHYFTMEHAAILRLVSEQVAASMYFCLRYLPDNLVYQATHDSLTQLKNRSAFMERLRREVHVNGCRYQHRFGLMIIDMNGLKRVNDEFGHRAGDAMLGEMARRLQNTFRPTDLIARIGGDEFGVVVSNIQTSEALTSASQRLNAELAAPHKCHGKELSLSASVGSAAYPDDAKHVEQLIEVADQRMYQRKRAHYQQEFA